MSSVCDQTSHSSRHLPFHEFSASFVESDENRAASTLMSTSDGPAMGMLSFKLHFPVVKSSDSLASSGDIDAGDHFGVALEFFHNAARLELKGFELSGIEISPSSYSSLTALRHRRHMYFLLANISRLFDLLSRMQTPLSSGFFVIKSADDTPAAWRI